MPVCGALFVDYSLRLNYGRMCVKKIRTDGWMRRTKRILFYLFDDCEKFENRRFVLCVSPREQHLNVSHNM